MISADHDVIFIYRDLLKEPLSADELGDLAKLGGMSIKDLLNPRSTGFKKLNLEINNLKDNEAVSLINENPRIMRRPLLTDGKTLLAGFDAERYTEMIST